MYDRGQAKNRSVPLPSRDYLVNFLCQHTNIGLCTGFAAGKSLARIISAHHDVFPRTLWISKHTAYILYNAKQEASVPVQWGVSPCVKAIPYHWTAHGIVLAGQDTVPQRPDRPNQSWSNRDIEDPSAQENAERLRRPTPAEAQQLIDEFGIPVVADFVADTIYAQHRKQGVSSWTDVDVMVNLPTALLVLELKQSHTRRSNLQVPREQFQHISQIKSWMSSSYRPVHAAYIWQLREHGTYTFGLGMPSQFNESRLVSARVEGHFSRMGREVWDDDTYEDGSRNMIIPLGLTEQHGRAKNLTAEDILYQPVLTGHDQAEIHLLDRSSSIYDEEF